jgi:urea carboxylase
VRAGLYFVVTSRCRGSSGVATLAEKTISLDLIDGVETVDPANDFYVARARRDILPYDGAVDPPEEDAPEPELQSPLGGHAVDAHVATNVWKVSARAGQEVIEGETLVILEAMKMEMAIASPVTGIVPSIRCSEGQMVMPGQTIAIIISK